MRAIVLSRRDFREFDQIVTLFTEEEGKVELLARGIKKIISKQSAHAEPFSAVEVSIARGKEIDHLTGIMALDIFPAIRADLAKNLAAAFAVSITDKLIEVGQKDERVYQLLTGWLRFVNGTQAHNRLLPDGYMVKLLNCLGLDITCAEKIPNEIVVDLAVLANGDWPEINRHQSPSEKLHDFIYQFTLFHTGRKPADWKFLACLTR